VAEFIPDGAASLQRTEAGEIVRHPLTNAQNMWVVKDGAPPAVQTS